MFPWLRASRCTSQSAQWSRNRSTELGHTPSLRGEMFDYPPAKLAWPWRSWWGSLIRRGVWLAVVRRAGVALAVLGPLERS